MATRRPYTEEFKAKVSLEALRGEKTIQEIAARHKVHPNQVSAWKQRGVEELRKVFSKGGALMRRIDELFLNDPFYGSRRWSVICGGMASVRVAAGSGV